MTAYVPVWDLAQTDRHPWWACHCDACAADRALFMGEPSPQTIGRSVDEQLIDSTDAHNLRLIAGGRKW